MNQAMGKLLNSQGAYAEWTHGPSGADNIQCKVMEETDGMLQDIPESFSPGGLKILEHLASDYLMDGGPQVRATVEIGAKGQAYVKLVIECEFEIPEQEE